MRVYTRVARPIGGSAPSDRGRDLDVVADAADAEHDARPPIFSTTSPFEERDHRAPGRAVALPPAARSPAPAQVRDRHGRGIGGVGLRRARRAGRGRGPGPTRTCALSAFPIPVTAHLHLERAVLLDLEPGLGRDDQDHAGRPGDGQRAHLCSGSTPPARARPRSAGASAIAARDRLAPAAGAGSPRPVRRRAHRVAPQRTGGRPAVATTARPSRGHAGVHAEHARYRTSVRSV